MRARVRFIVAWIALLTAWQVAAQQHPNVEKGFHADKVYSSADLDHVNLFNGNLNIAIPLGQRYRVSSTLDYGLSLFYAGNNWDTEYGDTSVFEQCEGQPAGDMCWDNKKQNYAVPYRRSSAGLGWTLSLGRLYLYDSNIDKCAGDCIVYQSPDGGEHVFTFDLHGTNPGVTAHAYTNDNTYLRLRDTTPYYYVDFPDGTTHAFSRTDGTLQSMSDAFGNTVDVHYSVVLSPDTSACGTANVKRWDIEGPTGRHQYVYFRTDLQPYANDGIACRVDSPAFGGTRAVYTLRYTVKTISRQVVYTQVDAPAEVGKTVSVPLLTSIELPGSAGSYTAKYDIGVKYQNPTYTGLTSDDTVNVPNEVSDPLSALNPGSFSGEIISLRLPTGATVSWTHQAYKVATKPPDQSLYPGANGDVPYSNRVAGVKTRTLDVDGNSYVWSYSSLPGNQYVSVTTVTEPLTGTKTSNYFSICDSCNVPPYVPAEYGLPVYRLATPPLVQSSAQGPYLLPTNATLRISMNGATTTVPLPSGWQTVDQIVTALNMNNSFNQVYYARNLNLTNVLSIQTAAVGANVTFNIDGSVANSAHTALHLDTATHQGTTSNVEDGHYLSSEVRDASNVLLKRTYVSYDMDPLNGRCLCGFGGYDLNRRIAGETVLTEDPTPDSHYPWTVDRAVTDYTDFDGFGHYRTTTLGGNFPGQNTRTVTTNYNKADGDVDPSGYTSTSGSSIVLPPNGKWILNTYSSTTTMGDGGTSKTNFWFDPNTGFLQRQRILASGTTHHNNDTIVRFTHTNGDVTREEYFGGDPTPPAMLDIGESSSTGLGSGSLSAIALGTPQYRIDHTYYRGSLATSRYFDNNTGVAMPFYVVNRLIDPNTGLASSETDAAGLTTTFEYDSLNRLTTTTPSSLAGTLTPTNITYTDATSSSNAKVDVSTSPMASHVDYDALGRVRYEWTKMPAGKWSVVRTSYDAAGRKADVSTPEESTAVGTLPAFPHVTTFAYDALGRTGSVTGPDGKHVDTAYGGAKTVTRTVYVHTSATGNDQPATTTETYDRQGRLYGVREPIGTSTIYTYDVGNHIAQVAMDSGGNTQNRSFAYDNRGQLVQETHPESGTTSWSYDSRGHALTKFVNNGSRFNLRFTYDPAERLTLMKSYGDWLVSPSQWYVPAKEMTYASANAAQNWKLGKLESVVRHNWSATGTDVRVTQSFAYAGRGGTLSSRTTDITKVPASGSSVLLQKFAQSYAHDALGLMSTITYPQCADPTRLCGASTWDSIANTYDTGRITNITGQRSGTNTPFVTDVTYHPNGLPKVISHGNGMTDTQTIDSGMSRPKTIEFGGYLDCTAPAITTAPQGTAINAGQSATLTVAATGTAPLTYEWFDVSSTTAVFTSSSPNFTASPTQPRQYYVVVYNACGKAQSTPVQVTVNSCTAPSITSGPTFAPPGFNQSTTISVTATGTAPLHYAWFRGNQGDASTPVGTDSSSYTTPQLTATGYYWVRVSTDQCGSVNSSTAVVTVPLPAPTGLVATWTAGAGVTVQWQASAGAVSYIVERRSGGNFSVVTSTNLTSVPADNTLPANTTFIYRVRAIDGGQSTSVYSNYDLATTNGFPLSGFVAFDDLDLLLTGVNRIRTAAGVTGALTWTNVMATYNQVTGQSLPIPQKGVFVYAGHLLALRQAMNDARASAGVSVSTYAVNVAPGQYITASAWTEIAGKAQ